METCATCRFWIQGQCRRFPPIAGIISTLPDYWCGEYSKPFSDSRRPGGKARMEGMTPEQRREFSQQGLEVQRASRKAKTPKLKDVNMDARALGRNGGKVRAEKLSPERRAEIAKQAAQARWKKP